MQAQSTTLPPGTVEVVAYGEVVLFRAHCPRCDAPSYVESGMTRCCRWIVEASRIRQVREAVTCTPRRSLPTHQRDAMLNAQAGLCFYCQRGIYSPVYREGREVWLRPHADHFVPYAYLQTYGIRHVVIACHICNGFKSSKVFLTTDLAREYLAMRWRKKGFSDAPPSAPRFGL